MNAMKHTRLTCVRSVSINTYMEEEKKPLSNVQWRQVVEKKAYRGRMWKMMGKEPYLRGLWEHFSRKKQSKEFSRVG